LTDARQNAYNSKVTKDEFKRLRKSAGYTQASLSMEMGIHIRTVTRWEIGEVDVPRVVELALRYIADRAKGKGDVSHGKGNL